MFEFFKKKQIQRLDTKILKLEAYIQSFNMEIPSEESIRRMSSDEMWKSHHLFIDVDDVASLIKERDIKPVKIDISNAPKFVQIDNEREAPPLILMPDGKFGVPKAIKMLIDKKAQNPIIIVTSDTLPNLVINGNHRIAAAYKNGDRIVEGYVVNMEDCVKGGCLLKECVPVYEAYKKLCYLQEKRAAIKAA